MLSNERQGLTWVGVRSEEAWARGAVGRCEGGTRRVYQIGTSVNNSAPCRTPESVVLALLGYLLGIY